MQNARNSLCRKQWTIFMRKQWIVLVNVENRFYDNLFLSLCLFVDYPKKKKKYTVLEFTKLEYSVIFLILLLFLFIKGTRA